MLVIHLLGDDMTLCNILGLVRRTCSRNVKFHLMNCQFLDFASALEVYSLVQACREQQATRSLLGWRNCRIQNRLMFCTYDFESNVYLVN